MYNMLVRGIWVYIYQKCQYLYRNMHKQKFLLRNKWIEILLTITQKSKSKILLSIQYTKLFLTDSFRLIFSTKTHVFFFVVYISNLVLFSTDIVSPCFNLMYLTHHSPKLYITSKTNGKKSVCFPKTVFFSSFLVQIVECHFCAK